MSHDDIRAALEAATPGPWHAWDRGIGCEVHQGQDGTHEGWPIDRPCSPLNDEFRETFRKSDAHLIAHAPEWLAELLGELDRLGTLKQRQEQTITELTARAEAAEQAVQRVREFADETAAFASRAWDDTAAHYARTAAAGTIRALDGGEH